MHSVHGVNNISMLCILSAEKGTYRVPGGHYLGKVSGRYFFTAQYVIYIEFLADNKL